MTELERLPGMERSPVRRRSSEEKSEMGFAGAFWFGMVIGWIASVTFHSQSMHGLKDMATIVGVIGGAAVTRLFPNAGGQFAAYCIGMALGFLINIVCAVAFWKNRAWPTPQ